MGPVWSAPRGQSPTVHHVVVLGVPGAGRKTLVESLLNGAALRPAEPAVAGMRVLTGQRAWHSGRIMRVTTWSIGGSDCLRPLWAVWAGGATRVVFAVDAAGGPDRMALARDELAGLGAMPWVVGLPLVVVATKAQSPGALDTASMEAALCSAVSARTGAGAGRWELLSCDAVAPGDGGMPRVLQAVIGS